jgi:hypothetical protein
MAKYIWLFYFSKADEFFDTVIMVLRKNNHQITFLHVYHHCSIFVIWWLVTYIAPNGESYFSAALNSGMRYVFKYGCSAFSMLGANPPSVRATFTYSYSRCHVRLLFVHFLVDTNPVSQAIYHADADDPVCLDDDAGDLGHDLLQVHQSQC